MINKEDYTVIHTLHSKGYSNRKIAKILNINRKTVAKRLKQESLEPYKKRDYNSKLDPYKEYVKKRFLRHFHILFQLVLYLKRLKNKVIMARLE